MKCEYSENNIKPLYNIAQKIFVFVLSQTYNTDWRTANKPGWIKLQLRDGDALLSEIVKVESRCCCGRAVGLLAAFPDRRKFSLRLWQVYPEECTCTFTSRTQTCSPPGRQDLSRSLRLHTLRFIL